MLCQFWEPPGGGCQTATIEARSADAATGTGTVTVGSNSMRSPTGSIPKYWDPSTRIDRWGRGSGEEGRDERQGSGGEAIGRRARQAGESPAKTANAVAIGSVRVRSLVLGRSAIRADVVGKADGPETTMRP